MAERPALGTEKAILLSVLRVRSIPRGRDEYPDASGDVRMGVAECDQRAKHGVTVAVGHFRRLV